MYEPASGALKQAAPATPTVLLQAASSVAAAAGHYVTLVSC